MSVLLRDVGHGSARPGEGFSYSGQLTDQGARVRHGLAHQAPRHRPRGHPSHADPRLALLRDPGRGALDPARRRDHLPLLPRALPADHRRRRDRRRAPHRRPARPDRGEGRRPGARHLRPARHRRARRQRGHRRARRRRHPAAHRHQLDRRDAGVPARGVGARRHRGQPDPAQGQGRAHPGRARRRGPRLAGRVLARLHRRRLERRPDRHLRRRGGRLLPPGGGRPRRRRRRLPDPAVRPDPAARRGAAPAPPGGGGAHGRGRLRAAQAAARRLHEGGRGEVDVRRVRRPGRPAPVDQLHRETPAVLRGLDGYGVFSPDS